MRKGCALIEAVRRAKTERRKAKRKRRKAMSADSKHIYMFSNMSLLFFIVSF